ncbi:MAG: Folylpolyglutamate synthase [candidate division BRC1 bacterium ADurb.BinA364]|nr:MAG: Folylpolyglutamate synthase [candidate division BRC1 bacterium ADurb.BinA364]
MKLALVETGLGGRLDCVSAVPASLAVVASIGLDHMAILGDTIAKIARDKAGIIKPGRPVVVGPQFAEYRDEAMAELADEARLRLAPLIEADREIAVESIDETLDGAEFRVRAPWGELRLRTRLFGPAAEINLKTIVACVAQLRAQGFDLPDSAVRDGLAAWEWPGRLEVAHRQPDIVIDGAHNPISARATRQALDRVWGGRPIVWILGMLGDKSIASVLGELIRGGQGDSAVVFDAPSPRGLKGEALAEEARRLCRCVERRTTAEEALEAAAEIAGPRGAMVFAGSLYIVAPAQDAVAQRYRK